MSNKTIAVIKYEITALRMSLKNNIEEFLKANPNLELNIEIEKKQYAVSDNEYYSYTPKIEVVLK